MRLMRGWWSKLWAVVVGRAPDMEALATLDTNNITTEHVAKIFGISERFARILLKTGERQGKFLQTGYGRWCLVDEARPKTVEELTMRAMADGHLYAKFDWRCPRCSRSLVNTNHLANMPDDIQCTQCGCIVKYHESDVVVDFFPVQGLPGESV